VCVCVCGVFACAFLVTSTSSLDCRAQIELLGDWSAEFLKHAKLDIDLSAAGLGVRAKRFVALQESLTACCLLFVLMLLVYCCRFSLVVENGVIKHENIEESPSEYVATAYGCMSSAIC
jgi:peroxiredoxin